MIHPFRPSTKERRKTPAVAVHVAAEVGSPVYLASDTKSLRFDGHAAFLDWLTDPTRRSGMQHVWLTPGSVGWDVFVPSLLRAGYRLAPSKRRGEYTGLRVIESGQATGEADSEEIKGRAWHGRSASGLVKVEAGLSAEEQAVSTLHQLREISEAISERWPGATLGPSLASTGIAILRHYLERPLGCSREVAVELRARGAYGGGRIELFAAKGSVFRVPERETAHRDGEMLPIVSLGPFDVDMRQAYPSAMLRCPIAAEYVDDGPESSWSDDCTFTTCVVEVPDSLKYPPLRYAVGQAIYYPVGLLIGTWSAPELRAAVDIGCVIRRVHSVMRFSPRYEFAAFAQGVIDLRKGAKSESVATFAKGIAVQTVGALASRPSIRKLTCEPETWEGTKIDRPGIYEVPDHRPSEREVLSAAANITGIVRAWDSVVLDACQYHGIPVVHIHTDGFSTITDPMPALRNAALADDLAEDAGDEERSRRRTPIAPALDGWKVNPIMSLEAFAANQRVWTTYDHEVKVAAGGISRQLTVEEIRGQLAAASECAESTAWMTARRVEDGAWTRPCSTETIDTERHERIRRMIDG